MLPKTPTKASLWESDQSPPPEAWAQKPPVSGVYLLYVFSPVGCGLYDVQARTEVIVSGNGYAG
jgi:hypothetical protein